jgi:hypothetical protein
MVSHYYLLPTACAPPLLMTTRLTNQSETMLPQNFDNLIGG